jgi:hypothetical protein
MRIRRLLCLLLLGGGPILAQGGDPTPAVSFTDQEIQMFLDTFDQTYKNKDLPQDDTVAALANLKNAYNFLKSKGEQITKDQEKLQKEIVERIAKKGLFARKRPLVNLKCAEILGEIGDQEGAQPLVKYLGDVLDEKNPNPQAVETAFQSLAWIGPEDNRTLEFVLDYASKGKHPDITVAQHAIRACYQWRKLDGKTRKDFFDKIDMYLQGLYSKAHGGDPKQRGTYEQRYNACQADGLEALHELSTDGSKFEDPEKARAWYNDNKKGKWEDYVGPRFRAPAAPPPKDKEKDKDGAKPEG